MGFSDQTDEIDQTDEMSDDIIIRYKFLSEMSCVGWVMRGHVHFDMGPSLEILIPSL